MNSLSKFIGEPQDLPQGLPTCRDVLRFLKFIRLGVPSSVPNTAVLDTAADRVLAMFQAEGFRPFKSSVKRLVIL